MGFQPEPVAAQPVPSYALPAAAAPIQAAPINQAQPLFPDEANPNEMADLGGVWI
jgi:hypothetical protein